ncbi:hypothetical protein PACTADRAFT_49809 [Pachysolen tannophilus NRRL Y-2460]|uniref:BZIP domain-containing protein n=1 Tax=Pachysolen tannophilus NRRL Y-2460 TaxID=669874 RepID=A0A1E4TXS8_PACTA|nr:hypothetical protein PACTADRAFT_49809 [Pachysolen tannophilus NRRL Y-2460]
MSAFNLNLDYSGSPKELLGDAEEIDTAGVNLSLFSDSHFFDFDVFAKGSDLPELTKNQLISSNEIANEAGSVNEENGPFDEFMSYLDRNSDIGGDGSRANTLENGSVVRHTGASALSVSAAMPAPAPALAEFGTLANDKSKKATTGITTSNHYNSFFKTSTISNRDPDKKSRNTAASARFRNKKKIKQQETERTLKILSDNINSYNNRIKQLEIENKILKDLVLEKNENNVGDLAKLQKNTAESFNSTL